MIIVRTGRWLYAEAVDRPVDIIGLPYDFWFEVAKADGDVEEGERPVSLGQDGMLYYVRFTHAGATTSPTWPDSGAHRTIEAAMLAAQERAPSPIRWD